MTRDITILASFIEKSINCVNFYLQYYDVYVYSNIYKTKKLNQKN